MKRNEKTILYLFLYFDDISEASISKEENGKLNEILNGEFEMKDLCEGKRIIDMNIMRNQNKISEMKDLSEGKKILTTIIRCRLIRIITTFIGDSHKNNLR